MKRDHSTRTLPADRLFENLVTVPELIELAGKWLRRPASRPINRNTVYKWVRAGMPSRKIRGERYFPKDEVANWLTRTS